MEIEEQIIAELEARGKKGVRALDKLAYTNGVTHTFYKGQYFACYDENDPEWKLVIFNSKGTPSENGLDRHDNLATTLRKRVKITDIDSGTIQILGSHTEAAKRTKVPLPTISKAARFNGTCDAKKITTSKTTGMKYYVVNV